MKRYFYGFLAITFLICSLGRAYGATVPGTVKWSYTTGGWVTYAAAIGADGTIYIGSDDQKLYAINPDGSIKWSCTTGTGFGSASPVVASDGTIYVGSTNDHKLYAVNPTDGIIKWSYTTEGTVDSSPAIAFDGTIYVGSYDGKLYAINPNGTPKWSYTTEYYIYSSPAIGSDGTIYVGSADNKLYAINPDGSLKWSYATGNEVGSSPAIGSDGTIYAGSADNKLYAINPDGSLKWSYTTGDEIWSSPSIGADGTIYVGSVDHKLYAIDSNGTFKWSYLTGGNISTPSPAIGADGTIYIGSEDNGLYAINPNGTSRWSFFAGGWFTSSPTIASDGTIYIGSWDKKFYAITSSSLGLADSPWPMFHRDVRHTGAAPFIPTLTVVKDGTGIVTSAPSGIDCGTTCSERYPANTSITLAAAPSAGSVFSGWYGDCSGTGACIITMSDNTSVGAVFDIAPLGVPKISLSPSSINVGTVKKGLSVSKIVTVKNTGTGDLVIGDPTIGGANASEFSLSSNCTALTKNQTCAITVSLFATSFGAKVAVLNIPSNYAKKLTSTVSLKATCAPPKISASPMSINFGTLTVGSTSAVKKITIKNTGTSDLIIASVSKTGDAAFAITDNTCSSTIAKGGSCSVSMTFKPSATSGAAGSLVIASNDPTKATVTVKLSGKGK